LQSRAANAVDLDAMHARRLARHDEIIDREVIRPGIEAWLDEADALGLKLAVASSSSSSWVKGHLERLGVLNRFSHISCAENDVPPKPAPDTYLRACAAIGVEPNAALAVEDSPNGASAAKAAGLWCVVVPHAITEQLDLSHADVRVDSLAHVTIADVIDELG
jgi:HAD superfamily hydrolase (TIGR01509 family)